MKKGSYRTHCKKCHTERILLNNNRYICPKCSREASLKHYHSNKKPLTEEHKESKKLSNLKWKNTLKESGFTNQQIAVINNRYGLNEKDLIELVEKKSINSIDKINTDKIMNIIVSEKKIKLFENKINEYL